jgi:hypothetical protein
MKTNKRDIFEEDVHTVHENDTLYINTFNMKYQRYDMGSASNMDFNYNNNTLCPYHRTIDIFVVRNTWS